MASAVDGPTLTEEQRVKLAVIQEDLPTVDEAAINGGILKITTAKHGLVAAFISGYRFSRDHFGAPWFLET